MEGQLAGPHDQSRRWDWLEAAGALTTSKHPDHKEKNKTNILSRGHAGVTQEPNLRKYSFYPNLEIINILKYVCFIILTTPSKRETDSSSICGSM